MNHKILIVDDDSSHRKMLHTVLSAQGFLAQEACDGSEAIQQVENQFYDLILMDLKMARVGGLEALRQIKEISPGIPIIIMTAYASVNTAVDALKSGAFDYLTKPLDIEELKLLVHKALEHHQLKKENLALKEQLGQKFDFANIIGRSDVMQKIFEVISMVAPTEANVLITGESGTGKELIANAIHLNSSRKDHSFVKVNCAALAETLLESELFGHERGAFTGAVARKQGRFQLAHKGSIFLDEIAEMSTSTQAKILRVLQEREFEPVGGSQTIKVDTRVIAATNKNLEEEIDQGQFREDLFYRLNVVNIQLPPLRDRKEDIPLLTDFFLKKYASKNNRMIKGITPRAMDLFMRYHWPGNIRELENMMERSVIMTSGDYIPEKILPDYIKNLGDSYQDSNSGYLTPGRSLKDVEKEMILRTLEASNGNRTKAAEILGISRRTLQLKLKDYGIQ